MTLGKRYIALKLDGGEEKPIADLRKTPWTHTAERGWKGITRVLEIDLDDAKQESPPESAEAAYARNERVMLAAAAEVERLKAVVSGKPPKVDELAQMRAVIEAMRPIVERAVLYFERCADDGFYDDMEQLANAVTANRDRLGLAMAAWESGERAAVDDPARCAVCGWPLYDGSVNGCVRGNCSMRPRPKRLYAPGRAAEESSHG